MNISDTKKEAIAVGKMIKVSPRKLNILAGLIRNKNVSVALNQLAFSRKRASEDLIKVLKSAIANAENNLGLDVDSLVVKEASVGKSLVLKRGMPRAKGRMTPILKPFSRVRIVLKNSDNPQNESKTTQSTKTKLASRKKSATIANGTNTKE